MLKAGVLVGCLGLVLLVGCGSGGGIYEGDVVIASQEDLERYDNYSEVTGSVKFTQSDTLESFNWSALVTVQGDLWVWDNTKLTSFSLGSLTAVGGGVLIRENDLLTSFNLNQLTQVGGNLGVAHNPVLPECRAEGLMTSVGESNIGGSVDLTNNQGSGGC